MEDFDATGDVEIFLRESFDEMYDSRDICYVHPTKPWPDQIILNSLSSRIMGRFIITATIVRLVGAGKTPSERVEIISNLYKGRVNDLDIDLGNIDSVYRYVICDCAKGDYQPEVQCISDIIALAKPLKLPVICELFGINIRKTITHTAAIVHLPSTDTDSSASVVQAYHPSLRDCLWDESRSEGFHVSSSSSHSRMLQRCLSLIKNAFRQEDLDNPPWDISLDNYERFRPSFISNSLRYACSYWSHHLVRSELGSADLAHVLDFLRKRTVQSVKVNNRSGNRLSGRRIIDELDTARTLILDREGFKARDEMAHLLEKTCSLIRTILIRTMDGPKDRFICSCCSSSFWHEKHARRHMEEVHNIQRSREGSTGWIETGEAKQIRLARIINRVFW